MNIFNILNIKILLISLIIGLIFIYIKDEKKIITIYPTISNKDKIQYKDIRGNCFEYDFKSVKCPSDSQKINTIPVN
tara:strand:- start:469 stop:699 length:231 start_codon:yes stop_codon:yes gene_type:complete